MPHTDIYLREIEYAGNIFKAVSHEIRLEIIRLINDNNEINVNKIYSSLNIKQPITSQHLRTLRMADVVNARRDGKKVYYSLNVSMWNKINRAAELFADGHEPSRYKKKP